LVVVAVLDGEQLVWLDVRAFHKLRDGCGGGFGHGGGGGFTCVVVKVVLVGVQLVVRQIKSWLQGLLLELL